jgi:hypothetical protein
VQLGHAINPAPTRSNEDGGVPAQDDQRLTVLGCHVAARDRKLDLAFLQGLGCLLKVWLWDSSDAHTWMTGCEDLGEG